MQVVIPIAGKGERMAETFDCPKQLIHVSDKPIIEYCLKNLPPEIDELVLIVGGVHEEQIREYFDTRYKQHPVVYVKQSEPLGLGHAIMQTKGVVSGKFLVVLPNDIYSQKDLQKLIEQENMTLLVHRVTNPQNYSVVIIDEKTKEIIDVANKPEEIVSNIIPIGASLLDEDFFKINIPTPKEEKEILFLDIIMKLIKDHGLTVKTLEASMWLPINNPEELSSAQAEILALL